MRHLVTKLRAFRDDEQGSMSIELLLVVPILLWVFLSTFVYFDVYRVETNSVRATIALAEMFSREDTVDSQFVDSTRSILRELTYEEANPDIRATVYEYNVGNDRFRRVWSEHRGMGDLGGRLNNSDLRDLQNAGRLPQMEALDHAVLIETRTEYDAPFNIGIGPFLVTNLDDLTFTQDMIIRPRSGRLCFDPDTGAAGDEVCADPNPI